MSNIAKSLNVQKRINAAEKRVNRQHTRNAEKFEEEYNAWERELGGTMPLVHKKNGETVMYRTEIQRPRSLVLYKLQPGEVPSVMRQHMKRSRNVTDEEVDASYKRRLIKRGDLKDGA